MPTVGGKRATKVAAAAESLDCACRRIRTNESVAMVVERGTTIEVRVIGHEEGGPPVQIQ